MHIDIGLGPSQSPVLPFGSECEEHGEQDSQYTSNHSFGTCIVVQRTASSASNQKPEYCPGKGPRNHAKTAPRGRSSSVRNTDIPS